MNQLIIILFIILILAVVYIYLIKGSKRKSRKNLLWQECRKLLRLPDNLADKTIKRHIELLKARHPNRTEEWYLEKILYDLERDRH